MEQFSPFLLGMPDFPKLKSDKETHKILSSYFDIVWGPAIYRSLKVVEDNLAMVVKKDNKYIVIIQGTNPYSIFDIVFEDLLLTQIDWNIHDKYAPIDAKVSRGSIIGFNIVMKMKSQGVNLENFIKDKEVFIYGHSLGGCIATLLGLYFKKSVMVSGCPTLGNRSFCNYVDRTIQYIRYANILDPTSYLWQDAGKLDTLYPQKRKKLFKRNLKQEWCQPLNVHTFEVGLLETDSFSKQAYFQHIEAYRIYSKQLN